MSQFSSYFPGVGILLVAMGCLFLWNRSEKRLWRFAAGGAIAWIIAITLKFAWKSATNDFFQSGLTDLFGTSVGDTLYWIYRGLLTGVFECGLLMLIVPRTNLRKTNWSEAAAFGVGFGAVEAMALGINSIVRAASQGPEVELSYVAYVSAIRFLVTIAHVFACVAILFAFSRIPTLLWWLFVSFFFKSILDAVGALLMFSKFFQPIPKEIAVLYWTILWASLGFIGLWYLRKSYNHRSFEIGKMQTAAAS